LQNLIIFLLRIERVDFSEVTGGRVLSFCNLFVGETTGPDLSGQCGGPPARRALASGPEGTEDV